MIDFLCTLYAVNMTIDQHHELRLVTVSILDNSPTKNKSFRRTSIRLPHLPSVAVDGARRFVNQFRKRANQSLQVLWQR